MSGKYNISAEALSYAAARYGRPKTATGTISREDAAFLFDMIMSARPEAIAEIGVASGVSTAFLSTLLSDRLCDSRLYSFDQLEHHYDDPSKRIASFVFELFDGLPHNLTLAAGIGSTGIRAWPQRPSYFDFVFLDASHVHPWPCVDLLSVVDVVKPGSWVVLHDIWLPLVNRAFQQFGPLYLYQVWPGEKCSPSAGDSNIGAIRLFQNPAESAAALIDCCRIPWQKRVPQEAWASCLQALEQVDFDSRDHLLSILENPPVAKQIRLRSCEFVVRGINPWTSFAADLISDKMVLHANRRGEPVMSIVVRGLRRDHCSGVVLPRFCRSDDTAASILVTFALRFSDQFSDSAQEVKQAILLRDSTPSFCCLLVPDGRDDLFELEISVALVQDNEKLHGAWVKFEALQFV